MTVKPTTPGSVPTGATAGTSGTSGTAARALSLRGVAVYPGYLGPEAQAALRDALRAVVRAAPMHRPVTPGGRRMSVRMTAAGRCGWVSDAQGYRYAQAQATGAPWPEIPAQVLAVWRDLTGLSRAPDCCLVNYYGEGARMGMHQDRDEGDFQWPVLSISLGDEGLFRVGGTRPGGPTESLWLKSGDVLVLGGSARLAYHGVDRIRFGSSGLLRDGGRLNITCRVVA